MAQQQTTLVPPFSPNFFTRALATMTSLSMAAAPLSTYAAGAANSISADGKTNTQVSSTANGAAVIQIAKPTEQGYSHNSFSTFNLGTAGAAINNSLTQSQSAVTGGAVAANANLLGGAAASTIGLEVTGSKQASTLSGPLEVLGNKASLILFNPWGVTVNGLTLSNTSDAKLVVGAPTLNNGTLTGFDTSKANAGAALNISGTLSNAAGAIGLFSPTITANAASSIKAADDASLTISIGQATFNSVSGQILSASPTAPTTVSVDANLLGAMKAGRINIITTRTGAGVNVGGTLSAQGLIDIDSKGTLTTLQLNASGQEGVLLQAANQLSMNGGKLSGNTLGVVSTQGNVTTTGVVLDAQGHHAVVISKSGTASVTGSTVTGDLLVGDDGGAGKGSIVKTSSATGSVYVQGNGITLDTVSAGVDLSANSSGALTRSGVIKAANNLTLNAKNAQTLDANLQTGAGGTLTVGSASDVNLGGYRSTGNVTVASDGTVSGSVSAADVKLSAKKAITFDKANVTATGALEMATEGDITINRSTISAKQNIAMAANGQVTVSGGNDTTHSSSSTSTHKVIGSDCILWIFCGQLVRDTTVTTAVDTSTFTGSSISSGANLTIAQAKGIAITGSTVKAVGNASYTAGVGSIAINSASNSQSTKVTTDIKENSWLNQRESWTSTSSATSWATASKVSSDANLTMISAGDIKVAGSTVTSGKALVLSAANDIALSASTSTTSLDTSKQNLASSFSLNGLLSLRLSKTGTANGTQTSSSTSTQQGSVLSAQSVSTISGGNTSVQGGAVTSTAGSTSVVAAGDVSVGTTTSTSASQQSTNSVQLGASGTGGLSLFPLGVSLTGQANLSTLNAQSTSASTTQAGATISASDNASVQAGNTATLNGTVITAANTVAVTGTQGVVANAATSTSSSTSTSTSLQGSGTLNGNVNLFQPGNLAVNGSVSGNVSTTSSNQATSVGVSLTGGQTVAVVSAQGDITTQGINVAAGSTAILQAAGNVTTASATNSNSATSLQAGLNGDLTANIGVSSGLGIVSNVLSGGSIANNIQISNVAVSGSVPVTASLTSSTSQNGGSISAGSAALVQADGKLTTSGTSITAASVQVSGTQGVTLGQASNTSSSLNGNLTGTLQNVNVSTGNVALNVTGNVAGAASATGTGTNLQGSQVVVVDAAQGNVQMNGANISGGAVAINGTTGVSVGTTKDITSTLNGNLSGPVNLNVSSLNVNAGSVGASLSLSKVSASITDLNVNAAGTLSTQLQGAVQANLTTGGSGSSITATNSSVDVAASAGSVTVKGSTVQSATDVNLLASKGVNVASATTVSVSGSGQATVDASGAFNVKASVAQVGIDASKLSLNASASGISVNAGTQLNTSIALSGAGQIATSSTGSTLIAGQDVNIATPGAVQMSKPTVQAGNQINVTGSSVSVSAPTDVTLKGSVQATLPTSINLGVQADTTGGVSAHIGQQNGQAGLFVSPTSSSPASTNLNVPIDVATTVNVQATGGIDVKQSAGSLTAGQAVNLSATQSNLSLSGTTVTTPGSVSLVAKNNVSLNATTSFVDGVVTHSATNVQAAGPVTVAAGNTVNLQATTLSSGSDLNVHGGLAVIGTSTQQITTNASASVSGSLGLGLTGGVQAVPQGSQVSGAVALSNAQINVTASTGNIQSSLEATPTLSGNNVNISSGLLVSMAAPSITATQAIDIKAPVVVSPTPVLLNTTGGASVNAGIGLNGPIVEASAAVFAAPNSAPQLSGFSLSFSKPTLSGNLTPVIDPNTKVSIVSSGAKAKLKAARVTINGRMIY